jgi:hypothetical protein
MDSDNFDGLTRMLMTGRSRRGALAALLGGTLALLGLADAAGKGKKGQARKGTGKKKQRRSRRPVAPPSGLPAPACADGITNGSETDIDCGGACPRCANDRTCVSQDDCASALCVSGVCKACRLFEGDCGIDAAGACECRTHSIQGQPTVCISQAPADTFDNCDKCPADTFCVRTDLGAYTCYQPCGAV